MIIDVPVILTVSSFLVFFGLWGILRHRGDLMRILLALQLIFLGSLFNFSMGSALFSDASGVIFSLFIACLTGVQTVASLALFLLYFRKHDRLIPDHIEKMKG
ncbi:MAG: NADH-quinone oxidoreductase subunit K [Alphaproteobacteria bacterium]|nr:NADH-quinone oxidoreductase subunit K [Alphaproteobacteria bacterium]MBO4643120.1 NADH-quinone oxidoreductase subunit K [Alphaproteobacteria bacterium]